MIVTIPPESSKGETKTKLARPQLPPNQSFPHSLHFSNSRTSQLQQNHSLPHSCQSTRGVYPLSPLSPLSLNPATSLMCNPNSETFKLSDLPTCQHSSETRLLVAPFATV